MWNRISRVTQPAAEAVTLSDVKLSRRNDFEDDDVFLNRCIKAAREVVEGPNGSGVVLMASQWSIKFDAMPREIWIPMGPVLSIDSISYIDDAGDTQTLDAAAYQWRAEAFAARVRPAYQLSWPTVRRQYDAVTVTFTAGFPGTNDSPVSRDNLPGPLVQAMHMLIGHWDENREAVVVGVIPAEVQQGFNALINMYRVGRVA